MGALAAFVRKPLQSSRAVKWQGGPELIARLLVMAQGFGGKEEVRKEQGPGASGEGSLPDKSGEEEGQRPGGGI